MATNERIATEMVEAILISRKGEVPTLDHRTNEGTYPRAQYSLSKLATCAWIARGGIPAGISRIFRPGPSTRYRWQLFGYVLAMLASTDYIGTSQARKVARRVVAQHVYTLRVRMYLTKAR